MPPKSASNTWPPRRTSRTTARKSIPSFSSTNSIHSRPRSSTTAAVISSASAAIDTSSEPSRETRPLRTSNSENTLQIPPHETTPASQTQSLGSRENLASNSGLVNSDGGNYKEPGKSCDLENSGVEHCWPEKIIHAEAATVVGSGDGSKNVVDLASLPVERRLGQDEGSVKHVIESAAGIGNGKRKIVKKTVRVVKKVIKKRVPKRVSMNGPENRMLVKAEDGVDLSEVREKLNLANDVIGKSNVVDEVLEKTSAVDEAKDMLNIADDLKENSNLVNDHANGKSDLEDRVTDKTSITNEVMEKANITDEATQNVKLVNTPNVSKPIIGKAGNELSGIGYMESEISKQDFDASFSKQIVPANDQSGINTMDTDNKKSNDIVSVAGRKDLRIRSPDLIEVEKVNYAPGTIMETKEIVNTMTVNQLKDSILENHEIDNVDKVDVELLAGQNVGAVGEKSVVLDGVEKERTIGKADSGSEVETHHIRLTERLLLSGEMEALERKKRRKTEIFLGGLHKDTKEDHIRKVFEEAGVIVEVRLVMNGKTGKSRGFAFVRFATAAAAKNALEKYSKVEICGKQCSTAPVEGNDTIFLGNIDRNWKTEDLVTLLEKAGIRKVDKVTVKADPNNILKNRGFAFVELQTSKDAQVAFNKLQKKDAFGKKQMVKVAWAQPLTEPAEEEILQVKAVYAEYLPSSWDEEKVKDYFKRFGEIENVVLAKDLPSSRRKDFAFINYTTRDAALTCIEAVNRERLEDDCSKVNMAVSLAKPISKRKQMKHTSDLTSKQLFKEKEKAFQASKKQHEPTNKGKAASSSYDHIKVDNRPSTTDELVQILREQASSKHIPRHPRADTNFADHPFPLPGSKRSYSLLGYDPLYVERQVLSRPRTGSSYPILDQSSSSHGVGLLSFPYHHREEPGFTSELVNGGRIYPTHFQTREQAPYYADNDVYHRYR